jgi:hypothetical protein
MFYVQKVTVSAIVGSKFSCATSPARTTGVRLHRVASMSVHLLQRPHPQVCPGRAPVPVRPLTIHRPIMIAAKGNESCRRMTSTSVLLSPCRDSHQTRRMRSYSKRHLSMMKPLVPPPKIQVIPSSTDHSTSVFTDAQTAKRLLDKGQPSSGLGAESLLSSSLPTTSPLGTVGGDTAPPRANSELGHYPDLNDTQGSHSGARNPQPSPERPRLRQGRRTSLHPVLEPLGSAESPSPGDRSASPEVVHQGASRTDMPAKVRISGPMNGTPIPPGHKFGAKEPAAEAVQSDRRDKVKSRMFQWSWRQGGKLPSILLTYYAC